MFKDFTSILEYLGGFSLAFIGFRHIREHFSNYSIRKFSATKIRLSQFQKYSSDTKKRILLLNSIDSRFKIDPNLLFYPKLNEKINKFLVYNTLRKGKEEKKLLERLFTNGSIISSLFIIFCLILSGIESNLEIENQVFLKFERLLMSVFFNLIFLLLVLHPFLTYIPFFRTVLKDRTRKVYIIVYFLALILISIITTYFVLDSFVIYYTYDQITILIFSFLFSFSSIAVILYRYFVYIQIKLKILNFRINKYEKRLDILKQNIVSSVYRP